MARQREIRNVVLVCPAVNDIDMSAIETLESINARLKDAGVTFHLSEVKGPVMDKIERSGLLTHLTGSVFLSQHQATQVIQSAMSDKDEVDLGRHNDAQPDRPVT